MIASQHVHKTARRLRPQPQRDRPAVLRRRPAQLIDKDIGERILVERRIGRQKRRGQEQVLRRPIIKG